MATVNTATAMTLARALRYRNKVQNRLNELSVQIKRSNSYIKGNTPEYKIREVLAEYQKIADHLVALKCAIAQANGGIQSSILRMAELKGRATMLRELDVRLGQEPDYSGGMTEWVSDIRSPEKASMIRAIESEIDTLQDKVDEYNANTRIQIEKIVD